jgi:hypothetical protein
LRAGERREAAVFGREFVEAACSTISPVRG